MAEAMMSLAVERLSKLLIEEGKFLSGVNDQADQLLTELKRMRWFLKDADRRQREDDRVGEWVSQFRDIAYEAENLIEHYAFKIQSREGRGVASKIKRCICLLDERWTLHRVRSDIGSLTEKMTEITTSFGLCGIGAIMENGGGSSSRRQRELRRTYSHVVEEDLVGIEGQVDMLAKYLVGETHNLVCIWGIGGLGKTTLARKVYYHPDVRSNFKAFSWICISQQWQRRDLLEKLLIKFMPQKQGSIKELKEQDLVRELFEFQQKQKCLVVLDDIEDVWPQDIWEYIKDAFLIKKDGSKVLLTSRYREVTSYGDASNCFFYQPQFLSDEQSWDLLRMKLRVQPHSQDCDERIQKMEELGKDMIKHCGGLPLAVLVLSGILATKKELIEWEIVHKNIKSYLMKGNKIGQGGYSILELSYNYLPYKLKPCFLYMSMYLEDDDINIETLYQIWMAEGLISIDDKIGEETMMEVAQRYLEELSKRGMVFVEMDEVPSFHKFKSCRLHKLMRDVCLQQAKEENFLELIDGRHEKGTDQQQLIEDSNFFECPRLAIHLDLENVGGYVLTGKELTQRLRSLSFSFSGFPHESSRGRMTELVFASYKMLRVLSIIGLIFSSGENKISLPQAIGNLVHLRCFILRDTSFTIVPSCISKLSHLETLDLRDSDIERVSNTIRKLRRLKYLYLPIWGPVCNIRLDGLHSLEILENFNNRGSGVKFLSTLSNLRSLTASLYGNLKDLEEFIKQVNRLFLRCLLLTIGGYDFDESEKEFTLIREMFSLSCLNALSIRNGRLSKLPEFDPSFLENVHTLSLEYTRMEEDPMRTLEKLPNLRRLSLWYEAFIGSKMICFANGFPQLKGFKIRGLPNLNNLSIEAGAMPNLSLFEICSCKELNMIPEGLKFISTLKELVIAEMPQEFNDRLQVKDKDGREGVDFNKVRHVPSVILR